MISDSGQCSFDPYNPHGYTNLSTALDEEGNLYNPSVNNYMSYFDNTCLDEFTPEQRAMLLKAFEYRTYRAPTFTKFTVYPNPARASDEIKINMDIDEIENLNQMKYQLQIFNSMGQLISNESNQFNGFQNMIAFKNRNASVASGTYMVNLLLIDENTQQVIYNQTQQLILIQ